MRELSGDQTTSWWKTGLCAGTVFSVCEQACVAKRVVAVKKAATTEKATERDHTTLFAICAPSSDKIA